MIFLVMVTHEDGASEGPLFVEAPGKEVLEKFLQEEDRPERKQNTPFRICQVCDAMYIHEYGITPIQMNLVLNSTGGIVGAADLVPMTMTRIKNAFEVAAF